MGPVSIRRRFVRRPDETRIQRPNEGELDLSGLHPSTKASRIRFSGGKRTVVDGPFAEAKELIAGYWLIQVKSREEALEWAKRVPFEDGEVELRQLFELEDFTPSAAIDHHRRVGDELAKQK